MFIRISGYSREQGSRHPGTKAEISLIRGGFIGLTVFGDLYSKIVIDIRKRIEGEIWEK